MTDEEQRKLAQEKDSFVKTASIAFSANYFALQKNVPQDDVLKRSINMADKLWDELQAWRERQ